MMILVPLRAEVQIMLEYARIDRNVRHLPAPIPSASSTSAPKNSIGSPFSNEPSGLTSRFFTTTAGKPPCLSTPSSSIISSSDCLLGLEPFPIVKKATDTSDEDNSPFEMRLRSLKRMLPLCVSIKLGTPLVFQSSAKNEPSSSCAVG